MGISQYERIMKQEARIKNNFLLLKIKFLLFKSKNKKGRVERKPMMPIPKWPAVVRVRKMIARSKSEILSQRLIRLRRRNPRTLPTPPILPFIIGEENIPLFTKEGVRGS